jgi:hydrogenase maturation protease
MGRLVIGIGTTMRGDDAAGLRVAQKLGLSDDVVVHDGEPASLIAVWSGRNDVVLIDAVTSGRPAGSIIEIDISRSALPSGLCHSTHALGVSEAVELARAIGKLPSGITLIGIEGRDYSFGTGMTAEVETAVDEVVARLQMGSTD